MISLYFNYLYVDEVVENIFGHEKIINKYKLIEDIKDRKILLLNFYSSLLLLFLTNDHFIFEHSLLKKIHCKGKSPITLLQFWYSIDLLISTLFRIVETMKEELY